MRRTLLQPARGLAIALLCLGVVAAGGPLPLADAWAASGSSEGGRVYDPKRLRTHKNGPAPGRAIKRPPIPEPEMPRALRSTAKIPSPEPRSRGGSGYVRRGKYFYEEVQPPQLTRQPANRRLRASIPNPEIKRRRSSAAH